MTLLPRALLWTRTDTAGAEHVLFDDRRGLHAQGTQIAIDPIPYTCRYELHTDDQDYTADLLRSGTAMAAATADFLIR